jgi:hypothetical protein
MAYYKLEQSMAVPLAKMAAREKIAQIRYLQKVAGLSEDVDQMMGMRRKTLFGANEEVGNLVKRQLAENMEMGRRLGAVTGTLGGGAAGLGLGLADDSLVIASPALAAIGAGVGNLAGRGLGMAGGALYTPTSVVNSLIGTPITRALSRKLF